MPKRTRSLGAADADPAWQSSAASGIARAATAAPAPIWRNCRREGLFPWSPVPAGDPGPSTRSTSLLLEGLERDILEEDDVVLAVVLEADPTLGRPGAALGLEVELAVGDGLALGVVGHLHA